jgi:UDP-N-acetylglucosamine 1-carboxyvinyltransferase
VEAFRVVGGARLAGAVDVPGAKNSALKLMAACLLAPGRNTITRAPDIDDLDVMAELLRRLGCVVTRDRSAASVVIDVPEKLEHRADYDLVRQIRASTAVLGPLVARTGAADLALPGGDAIGSRGLDMHVAALEALGAQFTMEHGYLMASAPEGLSGAHIDFDFPSVGATENAILAAVLADGRTVIDNAAREPEISDLCDMLVSMGAQISGIGSSVVTIDGVASLSPTTHATVPDRIVAGTWAVAALMTLGDIEIRNARADHLSLVLTKLSAAGADISINDDGFRVCGYERPTAVDIITLPYPGFPTDLQPMFIAMNAISHGAAMVTENLFESRFRFVHELTRLGADVRTDGHHAFVRGKPQLSAAPVEATDIRAGAGLVLAGLVADGVTYVGGGHHIDRGYAGFTTILQSLGADVSRVAASEMR